MIEVVHRQATIQGWGSLTFDVSNMVDQDRMYWVSIVRDEDDCVEAMFFSDTQEDASLLAKDWAEGPGGYA